MAGDGRPLRVVSAVDPKDFSQGLRTGPEARILPDPTSRPAVAVGDFDGDGRVEIAIAYSVHIQSRLNIYSVDPQTLAPELRHEQKGRLVTEKVTVRRPASQVLATLRTSPPLRS